MESEPAGLYLGEPLPEPVELEQRPVLLGPVQKTATWWVEARASVASQLPVLLDELSPSELRMGWWVGWGSF